MKAYIVNETINAGYTNIAKDTVLMSSPFGHGLSVIACATPTKPVAYIWTIQLSHLLHYTKTGQVREVEVRDLKWLHPHLLKQHKDELTKETLPA